MMNGNVIRAYLPVPRLGARVRLIVIKIIYDSMDVSFDSYTKNKRTPMKNICFETPLRATATRAILFETQPVNCGIRSSTRHISLYFFHIRILLGCSSDLITWGSVAFIAQAFVPRAGCQP